MARPGRRTPFIRPGRPVLKPGSPAAIALGRWGMALSLVAGAVVAGRVIRAFPQLLPNRLPGLVLYELGPGLALAFAIGSAVIVTGGYDQSFSPSVRLALFTLAALAAGIVVLGWEYATSLRGRWL